MALAGSAFATRQNYIRGIRALILHYQRVPEDCTVDELKAFLVFQRDNCNFSSSTVNLRVCGLKYYFREVVYRPDLVVKIPNPRVQKYDTDILTLEEWKNGLYQKDWVVYTKKPFSGVKKVVGYLARYSHRVAITNHRIKKIDEQTVTFEYKDYKDKAKKKLMTLKGTDFLQRFCLHLLPQRFRKVRQYGFLSNAVKAKSLTLARKSLKAKVSVLLNRKERKALAKKRLFGKKTHSCPCCQNGKMQLLVTWERNKAPPLLDKLKHLLF